MREALKQAGIDFYETPDSKWGFGSPGLWVRDEGIEVRAKAVIKRAQEEWQAAYREARASGMVAPESRWSVRYWAFVLLALAILGITLYLPWWAFG